ncbi:MAG TPA: FAD binding domain-containing protein [Oculatellaceae cyanobacterium]
MASSKTRDFVLVYVNGREHRVRGEQAFLQLSDYLRGEMGICGTKVVCAEGDCGACSILLGRNNGSGALKYKSVNSCIQAIYQLDCSHVITIEGLTPSASFCGTANANGKGDSSPKFAPAVASATIENISSIQRAMVECHGAQCGYCTPGFVVSLAALFEEHQGRDSQMCRQDVKDALTGNLCRCTGYESIIKSALTCDSKAVPSLESMYPSQAMATAFESHCKTDVLIETENHALLIPGEIRSAAEFKNTHKGTVIVSGGTDVCVNINKRGFRPQSIISTCNLRDMDELRLENDRILVGARITLAEIALFVKDRIPEFFNILSVFGAPQIRNAGTMAGNIANGSPIADTVPFLFVMEADVEVTGLHGTRKVPINSFYKGYKTLDLKSDEIITRISIPLPSSNNVVRLFKVSKREHLDISSFTAAVLLTTKSGKTGPETKIEGARIAFGGVAPTVVRLPKTERFLETAACTFDSFERAGLIAVEEIAPIADVRGSIDFRKQLAENILLKFYFSLEAPEPACSL